MDKLNNRPRFLTLWQIRLPITGVVSILHRISGVFMVLLLPCLIYLLQLSLSSPEGFDTATAVLTSWPLKILGLLLLWMFIHHLLAGIRVLFIDMEWGSDLITARRTSWAVIIGTLVLVIIIGGMLL